MGQPLIVDLFSHSLASNNKRKRKKAIFTDINWSIQFEQNRIESRFFDSDGCMFSDDYNSRLLHPNNCNAITHRSSGIVLCITSLHNENSFFMLSPCFSRQFIHHCSPDFLYQHCNNTCKYCARTCGEEGFEWSEIYFCELNRSNLGLRTKSSLQGETHFLITSVFLIWWMETKI